MPRHGLGLPQQRKPTYVKTDFTPPKYFLQYKTIIKVKKILLFLHWCKSEMLLSMDLIGAPPGVKGTVT
jgi:hypothetical protein